MNSSSWYDPLRNVRSLGSQHAGGGGLAGLHQAREEHLSQFFTPSALARVMWRLVEPAMARARLRGGEERVALFDNSVGTGRLFQFADPALHTLNGCDVHARSVEQLIATARAAGFTSDLVAASLQDVRPGRYNVALINPPFSIHLESPHLTPYPCNSYGRYGPGRACASHAYALAQALDCAQIVVAIVPRTFADDIVRDDFFNERLRWVADLPNSAFAEEGANVSTSIVVFDSLTGQGWERVRLTNLDAAVPDLQLYCQTEGHCGGREIRVAGIEASAPAITLPVTGDRTVRVYRHGRQLRFTFRCGLTQAKVLNALLGELLDHHAPPTGRPFPAGVLYTGEGVLDLHIHAVQEDPEGSLAQLWERIRAAGGEPAIDPGVPGYLRALVRRLRLHREPLGLTIRQAAADFTSAAEAIARMTFAADSRDWASPMIRSGKAYPVRRVNDGWEVKLAERSFKMSTDEFSLRFQPPASAANEPNWVRKFPGRNVTFPKIAQQWRQRARAAKLDTFLSWTDYQLEDLIEAAVSPFGCGVCWKMGLGKARLAIGLCLLRGGRQNLIVVEAHLVEEMVNELHGAPLDASEWQVIENVSDLRALRRINLITYNRLRQPLRKGSKRRYSHALRGRINTMVCDEGHALRNLNSEQTRAVWQVNPRRRHLLTGTPIANYPRDVFALLLWLGGDGTAAQPFGLRRGHLRAELIRTMRLAERGIDVFRDLFVTLEWAVNEFNDTLNEGAKREVPKISNLPQFRMLLAPFFKRRVDDEPDVAKYVAIPKPEHQVVTVEWDRRHFAYYLDVAEEFRRFYLAQRQAAEAERRNLNLIALLARISAVERACNDPASGVEGFGCLPGLTSKERAALARALEFVAEGHKTIVYARSPRVLERLARAAELRGHESVIIHGGRDIATRTRELNERFRFGQVDLLFASIGCTQTGLNLWQASRVIFLARDWRAITERQALARVLRPQQKRAVLCEFYHLPGSIDEYQAMMSAMKGDAADAGLDWATPQHDREDFQHIDHILGKFCDDVAQMHRVERDQLRQSLKRGA